MKITRFGSILLTATFILLLPLIAMQFTEGVDWQLFDFFIAAILLFGAGLLLEFVLRKVKSTEKRLVYCGIILLVLFLVWAELAVGFLGTPFAGS